MNIVEEAVIFATERHQGQVRKTGNIPYILHPLEVASIISTITEEKEVITAGILHDTIEDVGVTPEEIKEKFGEYVLSLVLAETEDKMKSQPAEDTWVERKEMSITELKETKDVNVKILWLADKLANIRSFYRSYIKEGDSFWNYFHQKDPKMHQWYYGEILKYTQELSDTIAYKEYQKYMKELFGE